MRFAPLFFALSLPLVASPALQAQTAGDVFDDCDGKGWCPEMVVVPAGTFLMGSPESEPDRWADEGPRHKVSIRRPFAIGVTEVTFDEWDACVDGGGCNGYPADDEGWGRGERPVVRVSWADAQAYAAWLSAETGEAYRLPSEAEWEYAARAGTTTPFHFGATISTELANYDGSRAYGSGEPGEFRQQTVPVGSFPANDFGLHDVHGNVQEWVEDCWNASGYEGAPTDGSAWTSGDCDQRVLRGGSGLSDPFKVRAAFRYRHVADSRSYFNGFRMARDLN